MVVYRLHDGVQQHCTICFSQEGAELLLCVANVRDFAIDQFVTALNGS